MKVKANRKNSRWHWIREAGPQMLCGQVHLFCSQLRLLRPRQQLVMIITTMALVVDGLMGPCVGHSMTHVMLAGGSEDHNAKQLLTRHPATESKRHTHIPSRARRSCISTYISI